MWVVRELADLVLAGVLLLDSFVDPVNLGHEYVRDFWASGLLRNSCRIGVGGRAVREDERGVGKAEWREMWERVEMVRRRGSRGQLIAGENHNSGPKCEKTQMQSRLTMSMSSPWDGRRSRGCTILSASDGSMKLGC